jgi:hypothetical protein
MEVSTGETFVLPLDRCAEERSQRPADCSLQSPGAWRAQGATGPSPRPTPIEFRSTSTGADDRPTPCQPDLMRPPMQPAIFLPPSRRIPRGPSFEEPRRLQHDCIASAWRTNSITVLPANGFSRKASAPPACTRLRMVCSGNAVMKMIGMRLPCAIRRS